MSSSAAIGTVSEALQRLLNDAMKQPKVPVTILAPDEVSPYDQRANLFLYKVKENAILREMDWQPDRNQPNQLVPPPLSLNLFYLMTAYASGDPSGTGNATAHAILGEAMRVLYENPVIPDDYLDGLSVPRERVKVIQVPIDMEELSRVWSTFSQPFRPSAMYEISLVQIDMEEGRKRPISKRVERIGEVTVKASFVPPTLERIEPVRGRAGTQVTVHGDHLAGWTATVRLAGERVLQTPELQADAFALDLPLSLKSTPVHPGLYELQVDVAHLCRRTFLFEVQE